MGHPVRLTITTTFSEGVYYFVVDSTETIAGIKALLEPETQVPIATQELFLAGQKLANTSTLAAAGLQGDVSLVLRKLKARAAAHGAPPAPGTARAPAAAAQQHGQRQQSQQQQHPPADPATLMEVIRADPATIEQLSQNNPELLQAVLSNDLERFKTLLAEQSAMRARSDDYERREREHQHLLMTADPFDPVAQEKIQEYIRQKNVEQNYLNAMEHNPESFARVTMLYVPCTVNGIKMKAFVDSGAQSTIMSEKCARECNIYHLIDTRFHGMAAGVGTAPILGRVHVANMQLGNSVFVSSFTIMKTQPGGQELDFLLGLDNLKRHQACIDLKANVLRIGGEQVVVIVAFADVAVVAADESVPFLPESEIPNNSERESLRSSVDGLKPTTPPPSSSSPISNSNNNAAASGGGGPVVLFPEDTIKAVADMTGASREDVIAALTRAGGDPNLAVQQLTGLQF